MPSRKVNLTEAIVQRVKAMPQRHKTWFDRLEEEHKAELLDVKRAWLAGDLKSSAIKLAEHISLTLRETGVSTVGIQGVVQWLRKRD